MNLSENARMVLKIYIRYVALTWFLRSHLVSYIITYSSGGGNLTQINYFVRKSQRKNIKGIKVIGYKERTTQHKPLVCHVTLSTKPVMPPCISPQRKTWKLKETSTQERFTLNVNLKCQGITADEENKWTHIELGLSNAVDNSL